MKNTQTKEYLISKSIKSLKKHKAPNWIFHIVAILIGILLIIIGSVDFYLDPTQPAIIHPTIKSILVSFGQALLVGMIISVILDLPFMKQYYRNRIVDVLVGDEYLNSLSKEQLEQLRSDCTEKIYIRGTTHFDETLIELDEKITKLLSKPYISLYRCDIVCKSLTTDIIEKKTVLKYWLVNPSETEAEETFNGILWLHKVESKTADEIHQVVKFRVKVDDLGEVDFKEQVFVSVKDQPDSNSNYSYQIELLTKEKKPISWKYKRTLEVEIEDIRLLPKYDNVYIKRLNDNPIKNLHVTYKTIDLDCRLEGTCMGTLAHTKTGQIRVVKQDSSISIESFAWLLPGNGIMIATLPR